MFPWDTCQSAKLWLLQSHCGQVPQSLCCGTLSWVLFVFVRNILSGHLPFDLSIDFFFPARREPEIANVSPGTVPDVSGVQVPVDAQISDVAQDGAETVAETRRLQNGSEPKRTVRVPAHAFQNQPQRSKLIFSFVSRRGVRSFPLRSSNGFFLRG